jgi:hypothetical protein
MLAPPFNMPFVIIMMTYVATLCQENNEQRAEDTHLGPRLHILPSSQAPLSIVEEDGGGALVQMQLHHPIPPKKLRPYSLSPFNFSEVLP